MARTIKHFSLHRIAGVELRVVAEVETGVLPLIQMEEAVIRGYIRGEAWPHHWVSLFILQDLKPLARQLPSGEGLALDHRPVVNVYDLANPAGCHIFVNREAMGGEGYWGDPLAVQGLLAHEHAHPLAENGTTHSSRSLEMELWREKGIGEASWDRIHRPLLLLTQGLCLSGPREIFANDMAIRSGFAEGLFYLDRRLVAHAQDSLAGREELSRRLREEMASGGLAREEMELLLLIGDLKGYLNLVLEVAPFYRAERVSEAQELEAALERRVFPSLEPEVRRAYTALRDQYIALPSGLAPAEFKEWSEGVVKVLAQALAEKRMMLGHRWSRARRKERYD